MRVGFLLGLAALLAGAEAGVTAQAIPAPPDLWADFPARIDNRAQLGHAPAMPWLNVAWIADEGARVASGDDLIRLDPVWVGEWVADRQRQRQQAAAELERFRVESANRMAELERRRAELADQAPALIAALATAAARDAATIAQARLRSERASDDASRLTTRAAAAEALATAGRLPAAEAETARSAATRAQLAARAAAHRLELEEDPEPGISELRAQLRLERLQAALGDAQHGIGVETSSVAIREAAELDAAQVNLANHDLAIVRMRAMMADPLVRATQAGTVRLRNETVRKGAKLSATAAVFVCGTGEQIASFGLPEELRGLVRPWSPEDPEAGRAEVVVLGPDGPRSLPGRLLSIGAAPDQRPDGRRAFPATVSLGAAGDALRLGMPATVRLAVPTPAGGLCLPAFCLGWAGRPQVLTPNGPLAVEAVTIGDLALVSAGLAPGATVLPWDPQLTGLATRRRLSGVLEAWERDPVRLRTTEWDVVEIAPDGSLVQSGAVVAKLVRNVWWIDTAQIRRTVLLARARAVNQRGSARADAIQNLARAELDRRQGTIDGTLAWIDLMVAEAPALAEDLAAAVGAAAEAATLARTAAAAVPPPDEPRADLSTGARTALAASATQAAIAAERAALAAVMVRRSAGLVAILNARETRGGARLRADQAESSWRLARTVYLRQLAGVARTYRNSLRDARWQREQLEGEVVRAPRAGRIHHRPGQPYKVGDAIDNLEPMYVPIGNTRRLALEIPASAVARFATGSTVPVAIPGLGREPRPAQVIACGTRFGPSADAGSDGTGEQVADLLLRLDLDPTDANRAGPGMTAHVDL